MRRLLVLALLLWLPASARQLLSPLTIDLDGDGRTETVGLRAYEKDGVRYGQLVVLGADGPPRWEAPKADPYIFLGEFDLGELSSVGDFDGDGKIELLGTYQKSDVSPTKFRLFRWDGKKFVHLKSGYLTQAPQKPATFVWSDDAGAARYVDSLTGLRDRRLKAVIAAPPKTEQHWMRWDLRSGELIISE